MKKINILKSNDDFNRIIKNYKPFKYKDYVLYVEWIKEGPYKFGFSVGKKIGNAVTRNKYKRRLKSIIDKKGYQKSFNCIIIVGKGILDRSYKEMEENLFKALEMIKITKEK